MKGAACSKARAATLDLPKIGDGSFRASMPQFLEDQIGLQTQQQGLAWIKLERRSLSLQQLSLVER